MFEILKWTLAPIALYLLLAPLVFIAAMELKVRIWPRRSLAPKAEREWIGAGAVAMKIADQALDRGFDPIIAHDRVCRVERYTKRLAAPKAFDQFACDGIAFAKALIRHKLLTQMPSPSRRVH